MVHAHVILEHIFQKHNGSDQNGPGQNLTKAVRRNPDLFESIIILSTFTAAMSMCNI